MAGLFGASPGQYTATPSTYTPPWSQPTANMFGTGASTFTGGVTGRATPGAVTGSYGGSTANSTPGFTANSLQGGGGGFGTTAAGVAVGQPWKTNQQQAPVQAQSAPAAASEPAPSSGGFDYGALASLLNQNQTPAPLAPTPIPEGDSSPAIQALTSQLENTNPSEGWLQGSQSSMDAPYLGKRNPPSYAQDFAGRRIY